MGRYIVAIDAMGGDHAPESIVAGTIQALRKSSELEVLLAGPEERLRALTVGAEDVSDRIGYIPADEVITMDETPMMAVRRKVNSSMVQAALAVKDKRAQAMVSAGSTGAVLACGMFRIGRIPGIERPALAILIPGVHKPFLLLDCGANADCQPKYLNQFGMMGSVYMRNMVGVESPAVGLVNIGTEAEKGNHIVKDTYPVMSAQNVYHFAGNVEARDIPDGECDVVVADGFTGNVILKYTEGLVSGVMKMIKLSIDSPLKKIGALLMKPAFRAIKDKMDYNTVGGAPLLGIDGAVVKAHGSSKEAAVCSAVLQAEKMIKNDVVNRIRGDLESLSTEMKSEEQQDDQK